MDPADTFRPPKQTRQARALGHLETAEAAVLSWSRALDDAGEDGDVPSITHILYSVLSSVSRAAGLLEADDAV